jgi:hypothetical protein
MSTTERGVFLVHESRQFLRVIHFSQSFRVHAGVMMNPLLEEIKLQTRDSNQIEYRDRL